MRIEKIETLPVTKASILILLNEGFGAFVQNSAVLEVTDASYNVAARPPKSKKFDQAVPPG